MIYLATTVGFSVGYIAAVFVCRTKVCDDR
jgi:hypothetical protein